MVKPVDVGFFFFFCKFLSTFLSCFCFPLKKKILILELGQECAKCFTEVVEKVGVRPELIFVLSACGLVIVPGLGLPPIQAVCGCMG